MNDMTGRVCVVTGANTGIGKATALGLARMGATVVMICRNRARGEAAQTEVQRVASAPVDLFRADLSSQAEVRQVADDIRARYAHIHVLIHNAGLQLPQRALSVDGIEMTLAVNHGAPFLLTYCLLDALKSGAPSRIVVISSLVHRWGSIDFDDLHLERGYTMDRAYFRSKLCNVLFTRELARRLSGSGVTANSLEPGLVKTDFARVYTGMQGWFVHMCGCVCLLKRLSRARRRRCILRPRLRLPGSQAHTSQNVVPSSRRRLRVMMPWRGVCGMSVCICAIIAVLRYVDPCPGLPYRARRPLPAECRPK